MQKNNPRLTRDFNDMLMTLKTTSPENAYFEIDGDTMENALKTSLKNMRDFTLLIRGPPNTPYSGGKFRIRIEIQADNENDFPHKQPKVTFLTKILHPNIKDTSICLDTLIKRWSCALRLNSLFLSIYSLLESPNSNDPLDPVAGTKFRDTPEIFKKEAIELTKKYAIPDDFRAYYSICQ